MKFYDIVKEVRPRERFLNLGVEKLSEYELLALILRTGTKNENILDLSQRIIYSIGLEDLFSMSLEELKKIKGIGEVKAMQISSLIELVKRYNVITNMKEKISAPKDVYAIFREKLMNEKRENFFVLLLDTKNKIIKSELISLGILDASIVHAREIFRPAIKHSSSKIILIHNHPSGDPTPSKEDLEITKKLMEAGEIIGIEIVDHIIIGKEKYWSWNENF